ncbi:tissue factor pathway inhibitor 2-like [Mytilus trossulus]|uniref:tissue factor pathway inhibitor 2-like n=1 Tax=Mytilus trossulus TaxID=6551 RepID=UPI003007908A
MLGPLPSECQLILVSIESIVVCLEPPEILTNSCFEGELLHSYTFDRFSMSCKRFFHHGGCKTTPNLFKSLAACEDACKTL